MGKIKDIATEASDYGFDISGMSVSEVFKLLQDMIDSELSEETEPEEFESYASRNKQYCEECSDQSELDALLDSRSIYGSFKDKAEWIQGGKQAMRDAPKWEYLGGAEQEALDNIMQKIGRVLYGEFHLDNWADIAGYATLVVRND